ncbi:hypothetical protein ABKN59_009790 [Abortiporus biennis]
MASLLNMSPEFDTSTIHEETPHPLHHKDYYLEDGNLVILVENILFRVFRSTFRRHSSVFNDLFMLPEPVEGATGVEGSSDENPLVFSGISTVDFERLLWILYPPNYSMCKASTLDEWTSILHLATQWEFADIRTLAIRSLQSIDISPVDRILLSREYDIGGRWVLSAYTALCERAEPLTLAEASKLGLETSVRVAQMREQMRGTFSRSTMTAGGYRSMTRSATAKRDQTLQSKPVRRPSERVQWDVGRSFLDQGPITPPPNRPAPKKKVLPVPRSAKMIADAFGLDIGRL